MKPIDQWGPRSCPRCGMPPMVYCKTASGAVAGLPHRERWPEGPLRTKTAEQVARMRARRQALEDARDEARRRHRAIRRMPKDQALRARAQDVMAAFRERAA